MALGLFRPVRLKVVFEERSYKLGETINFTIDLRPRVDADVREGRIDLVCEESYIQTSVEMLNDLTGGSHGTTIGGSSVPLARVPKRITKKHRTRLVHSSVVFLEETHLSKGIVSSHSARLIVRPEAPAHAGEGDVKWTVEVIIDLAGSRNVIYKKSLRVATL